MRMSKFSSVLLLAVALSAGAAVAADAPQLETINTAAGEHKDCPVAHGNIHDKCEHKDGKPCAHHKHDAHAAKAHDKCEHKQ